MIALQLSAGSDAILSELTEPRLHLKTQHVICLSDLLHVRVFLLVQDQQETLQFGQTECLPLKTTD